MRSSFVITLFGKTLGHFVGSFSKNVLNIVKYRIRERVSGKWWELGKFPPIKWGSKYKVKISIKSGELSNIKLDILLYLWNIIMRTRAINKCKNLCNLCNI